LKEKIEADYTTVLPYAKVGGCTWPAASRKRFDKKGEFG
jgi:hypothetical protein